MTIANIFLFNPLLQPNVGLMFWTLLTFVILLFVLRKFAWGPIMTGIKTREQSIDEALSEAKKAREEMSSLKSENEALLAQARAERDRILKEAKEIKDKMISDAKSVAQEEGKKIMAQAQESIEKEKASAFADLKEQVVTLAIEAASKIVRKE
ncbi:MAG: F0F1 ATP synthase subunit B, partial [Bacteroidia bacterium]